MKKQLTTIFAIGALTLASSAFASSVSFDVEGASNSFVNLTEDNQRWSAGSIDAVLSGTLASEDKILADGESYTFNFFTFEAENETTWFGVAGGDTFDVKANLSLLTPYFDAGASGDGAWGGYSSIFGSFSAGAFYWDENEFNFDAYGNDINITLSDGFVITAGTNATVTATITNNGGAPVPEPSTMLLFGAGLAGLVGYSRKRSNKKA